MDYYVEKNAPNSSYYDIVSVVKNFHDEFALPYGFPFFLAEVSHRDIYHLVFVLRTHACITRRGQGQTAQT